MRNKKMNIKSMTLTAILAALVVVLEWFAGSVKFGIFTVNLALVPIVIGAALCGAGVAAGLGFLAGVIILVSGQATLFLNFNFWATILVVLAKGFFSGWISGLIYRITEKKNRYFAVVLSAIACPLVNTGIFFVGCVVFFLKDIATISGGVNAISFTLTALIGLNFIAEMVINIVLSPMILRLINIRKKS